MFPKSYELMFDDLKAKTAKHFFSCIGPRINRNRKISIIVFLFFLGRVSEPVFSTLEISGRWMAPVTL